MRTVKLIQSVKTDSPYFICGDPPTIIELSPEAADFAVKQGYAVYLTTEVVEVHEPTAEQVGVLQKMNFKPEGVSPELPEDPVQHVREEAPERDPAPYEPVMKKPDGRSNQKTWAAYAASVDADMTLERAEGMSKSDLMGQYGSRF